MSDITPDLVFPIRDRLSWNFHGEQTARFWTHDQFTFDEDAKHYREANDNVKKMIDVVLTFFGFGDKLVNDNIMLRFIKEADTQEEEMALISQAYIETIHQIVYAKTIKRIYGLDKFERIFKQNSKLSCMKKKILFARKWQNSEKHPYLNRVAFCCFERILFVNNFSYLFAFKASKKFPHIVTSNETIKKDEISHGDYVGALAKRILDKIDDEHLKNYLIKEAKTIIREAYELGKDVANVVLQQRIHGLSYDNQCLFIKFLSNAVCYIVGIPNVFEDAINPYDWFKDIDIQRQSNFFEVLTVEYSNLNDVQMDDKYYSDFEKTNF